MGGSDVFIEVARSSVAGILREARTILMSGFTACNVDAVRRAAHALAWAEMAHDTTRKTVHQANEIFEALANRAHRKEVFNSHTLISEAFDSVRNGVIADRKCRYCDKKEDLIPTLSGKWICRSCNEDRLRIEPDYAEATQNG